MEAKAALKKHIDGIKANVKNEIANKKTKNIVRPKPSTKSQSRVVRSRATKV